MNGPFFGIPGLAFHSFYLRINLACYKLALFTYNALRDEEKYQFDVTYAQSIFAFSF